MPARLASLAGLGGLHSLGQALRFTTSALISIVGTNLGEAHGAGNDVVPEN